MKRKLALILRGAQAFALAFAAGACNSLPPSAVRGNDQVLFGEVDFIVRLGKAKGGAHSPNELVGSLSYADGSFDQALATGDRLRLNNTEFAGPGGVRVDFDLRRASFVFRRRIDTGDGVILSPFGGLAFDELDLELSQASLSEGETYETVGPRLGVRIAYEPMRYLEFFGQVDTSIGVGSGLSSSTTDGYTIGVALGGGRRLGLVLGYRKVDLEIDVGSDTRSDIELELSGPFLKLVFSN